MTRRQALISAEAATLVFEGTAAPAVPVSFGRVPLAWRNGNGAPAEMVVSLEAEDNTDLTAAALLAAVRTPSVLDLDVAEVDIDPTTNLFTAVAHGLLSADGPIYPSASVLPSGLEAYATLGVYVIRISADTFKVTDTLENAWAGTNPIDIADNGTGATTFVHGDATRFVRWHVAHTFGGTQTLDFREGFRATVAHGSDVEAYSIKATFSAAETVRARVKAVIPAS